MIADVSITTLDWLYQSMTEEDRSIFEALHCTPFAEHTALTMLEGDHVDQTTFSSMTWDQVRAPSSNKRHKVRAFGGLVE